MNPTGPRKCTGCQRKRQAQVPAKKVQTQEHVNVMNKEREEQIKKMFADKK